MATVGVMAAIAVSAIGCAGEEPTEPSETIELPTPPPSEALAVLDLETMTDEELLAEARRAYQGFFDDVEDMRASGSDNYLALDEWTTEDFRLNVQEDFDEYLPEGVKAEGVQDLLGMELVGLSGSEVLTYACLSNETVTYVDSDGETVELRNEPGDSVGEITLVLSPDESKLQLHEDVGVDADEVSGSLCAQS
ncbi:MAG: hypothetical protein ACTJHM_01695 [Agrococcus casei]|uniref:hypothetical protein n=1 Tax=Agrococcus casei TaxID=343512 RepID=UPI003F91E768